MKNDTIVKPLYGWGRKEYSSAKSIGRYEDKSAKLEDLGLAQKFCYSCTEHLKGYVTVDTSALEDAVGETDCEYTCEVVSYMLRLEAECPIREDHLGRVGVVGIRMRSRLVDWLATLQDKLGLRHETLHMAVSLLDRYMQTGPSEVSSAECYRLAGLAAICIAAKYEDRGVRVKRFSRVSSYSIGEIRTMECLFLAALDFRIGRPSSTEFLKVFGRALRLQRSDYVCSQYFIDLSLLEYSLCHVKPSLLATTAVFLSLCFSRLLVDPGLWTRSHATITRYRLSEFRHIVPALSRTLVTATGSRLQRLAKKYATCHMCDTPLIPYNLPDSPIVEQLACF